MSQKKKVNKKKLPQKPISKSYGTKRPPSKTIQKVKRTKIRYGRIFLVLLILSLLIYLAMQLIHFPIKNIFIQGNTNISDQEVIEIVGIQDYPSIFKVSARDMEKKLKKDVRISQAKVHKTLQTVSVELTEVVPLYYDQSKNRTILSTKEEIEGHYGNAPVLLNYIPDTKADLFFEHMLEVNIDIIERISEIAYQPNTVDDERFLLTMNDGNYVYLTLEKFTSINHYVSIYADITSKHGDKKGILNLDSGDFFTILD